MKASPDAYCVLCFSSVCASLNEVGKICSAAYYKSAPAELIIPKRKLLYGDSGIVRILQSGEGALSEKKVREVLKKYNLRDGLLAIAKESARIFETKDVNSMGWVGYHNPDSGTIITQFSLSYIACLLIVSGANDYKKAQLDRRANLILLCNVHTNCIVSPELANGIDPGLMGLNSMMVRMANEQLDYQFDITNVVARNIIIFNELINNTPYSTGVYLSEVFEQETGLTIHDYFFLAMSCWAAAYKKGFFKKEWLTRAQIPTLKHVLTEAKISSFLRLMAVSYSEFRKEDDAFNLELDPIFTKNRFNPLSTFPIVKTTRVQDEYIIPNTISFLKKAFGGIFWWFDAYYYKRKDIQSFRNYFGKIFENYVGVILKGIYGEASVNPEVEYGGNKLFFDWWVETGGKIFLFEAKAYQFPLEVKQTGNRGLIEKELENKIIKTAVQVHKALAAIDRFSELVHFRGKELIPVVICLNIPFVSSSAYKARIQERLTEMEAVSPALKGLSKSKIRYLNIDELEDFSNAAQQIDLEKAFSETEDRPGEGFRTIYEKEGLQRGSSFLEGVYDGFWKDIPDVSSTH